MNSTFSLRSLGCARSLVDSETMIDDLNQVGFSIVPEGSKESIMILNTCSFIQAAIDETESNIKELISKKKAKKLKYVVVTGCYPSRYKQHILEEKFPEVDLWFSTKEEHQLKAKLAELVFQHRFQPKPSSRYTKLTPTHFSYLKISEGCNNWCSFCTIPKIRGQHTSKPLDVILQEAQKHIDMGAQELVLIAEDTTCWGEDIYGRPSLHILLEELSKLDVMWIRNMYIFPSRVNDDLIRVIKNKPNITNYIDMPIQHVNSDLLRSMNRAHDKEFLEGILTDMFSEIPDLALRTTFITGFPGETQAHVDEICDFIDKYPFAQLGCFTYSKERETRSARLQNHVRLDIAHRRLDHIMKTQYTLLQPRLNNLVGKSMQVIYEGKKLCRSYAQAPEVDSVIILDSVPNHLFPGTVLEVKIIGTSGYDLLAMPTF